MRPPGSNFGRVLHSQSTKFVPPRRVMSEKTQLRVAIQQAAIRYPRALSQAEDEYAETLAKIMRSRGEKTDQFDLTIAIDRQLFRRLERKPKRVVWTDE